MAIIEDISINLLETFNLLIGIFPPFFQNFIKLFLLVLLVVFYSIFIWEFHSFISKKNIFGLDLNKYNKVAHPVLIKLVAVGLYFIEYIIVLPFLIFFWFSIFTLFLIFFTKDLPLQSLLIISAIIVSVIRMTSYYKKGLSKELAKLLPFTLLAVSMLNPAFFNTERILGHLNKLPDFFEEIIIYFVFIAILEIMLR